MKAKKVVALVVAMVMVFALSSVALAIPSPTGSNVAGTSGNVSKVEVKSISATKQADLEKAATDYIATQFGSDYVADTLLSMDLVVTRTDDKPVTLSLNVAGVNVGDNILVIHEKADGSKEIIPAKVLTSGVIEFTLNSFSPIIIVKVAAKGATGSPAMPKTGDSTTAVPMVLLLVGCVAALAVCGKALRKAK